MNIKRMIDRVLDTGCEFYVIFEENGVKYIEIDAYFHKGDSVDIIECSKALSPLSEYLSERDEHDYDSQYLLDTCDEYESETTPEEIAYYIGKYETHLKLSDVNENTGIGKYINL